jgi:type III secretory pathway component EscV
MSDFNHEFSEIADIIPAFVPVNLSTGSNAGQWVNMSKIQRLVIVFFKGAGITGDDPQIQVSQATNNAGANAKALNFNRIRTKQGGISSNSQYTLTTWTQGSSSSTQTGAAGAPDLAVIEVQASDLDGNNTTVGPYNHVLMTVGQTNSTQYGCGFYIAYGYRYPQSILPSNIS